MEGGAGELDILQNTGGKEESPRSESNNDFQEGRYAKGTGVRKKDAINAEGSERRKYFHQYIYQQDYEEALRSLLWEPYDCRDNSEAWYCREAGEGRTGAAAPNPPIGKCFSSSQSSLFSSSSSSAEETSTADAVQKSALYESECAAKVENRETTAGRTPSAAEKGSPRGAAAECERTLVSGCQPAAKEASAGGNTSEGECGSDPVQKVMNIEIMVSDLHTQNGSDVSLTMDQGGALLSPRKVILASASQCKLSIFEGGLLVRARNNNALTTVGKMLVTVEGTLEPRDSNEGTQLMSPESSLEVIDGSVNGMTRNQDESGPSGSNVSVVNCYRAVPVAVVSAVPMIKCLNTQENVSNVSIIQTGPNTGGKHPQSVTVKRAQPWATPAAVPCSSKSRSKVQKMENRRCGTLDQGKSGQEAKPERERPRSTNVCYGEANGGLVGQQTPSCVYGHANNGSSVLSNHGRSVSNPVLGNQSKSTPNRFGSQQNIPVRLDACSGPESQHGAEPPQSCVAGRMTSGPENVLCREAEVSTVVVQSGDTEAPKPSTRTFTSTEAQTDDVPLGISLRSTSNREQRRRERRERRHQRRIHQSVLNSGSVWQTNVDNVPRDARGLPDILNSHMPPPYSAVSMPPPPPPLQQPMHISPHGIPVPAGPQPMPPHLIDSPPGSSPSHQGGVRFPLPFPGSGRRSRGQFYAHEEETPKSCCGVVVTQTVSIRWFIVMIAFVGICCVIVGTVLGAMKASGREHLTVSLLMIGVGIILVTVSGVAWRLTSQDAPSCRSMLGLGGAQDSSTEPNRRFVPRMPPSYGRPHHPYAAMMYPEFQYRPPPPSYQASMQEYRLRLLLLERPNGNAAGLQTAVSPPPTYRSHAGSALGLRAPPLCRSLPQSEYSHPPSYRSRTSSTRPSLDPNGDPLGSVSHSRDPSLVSHVSDQNGNVTQAVVNVISVMGNTVDLHQGETDIQIDSIKLGVDEEVPIPPLRMLLNKGKRSPTSSCEDAKSENVNLVTIVTVSDSNATPARDHTVESDVLAHL